MKKKIILSLVAVVAVVGGVAALSAFEAHIINVTAHIENALSVSPKEIKFGTVFPQELLDEPFTVELSSSFLGEERVDDVDYVIKQKVKPCPVTIDGQGVRRPIDDTCVPDDSDNPPHNATGWHYQDLCYFLSKENREGDGQVGQNDTSHSSYFVPGVGGAPDSCQTPGADATGRLSKIIGDTIDNWLVDLKVPPVKGSVGQDWPTDCPTVPTNDVTYGCDLWIEVTGISPAPSPTSNE